MQGSTNTKNKIKVIIRKKNIPGNLKFLIGKLNDVKISQKRSKKVDGLSDYFSINQDPRFKEMMDRYNGFGWGDTSNDMNSG